MLREDRNQTCATLHPHVAPRAAFGKAAIALATVPYLLLGLPAIVHLYAMHHSSSL